MIPADETTDLDGDTYPVCNDCDDDPASGGTINPGASETCNGIDDNCSGLADDGASTCPCPVSYYGGKPYQICAGSSVTQVNWGAAEAVCNASTGYTLAAVGTEQENDFIYGEVASSLNPPADAVWLGGTDFCGGCGGNCCEGTWSWTSGDTWAYTNWAPDVCCGAEPNNFNGTEHTLEIGRNGDSTWNDVDGGTLNFYVCEFQP